MHTLGKTTLHSYFDSGPKVKVIKTPTDVRKASGHPVENFIELATKIAELQFLNPDFVLFFRGQKADYKNIKKNTTLRPSIFRPDGKQVEPPNLTELKNRYSKLETAESLLIAEYTKTFPKLLGIDRLRKHRILRWSILQHYEVCGTPLLDVTHSLRIAASFASDGATSDAFVNVIAIPNLSGAITASAEAGIQIIRLSSVCPPSALRPHIQEGYLLGEYPEMIDINQKDLYEAHELDFGRRLIAKFKFTPSSFWKKDAFQRVPKKDLYPDAHDPLFAVAQKVKDALKQQQPV